MSSRFLDIPFPASYTTAVAVKLARTLGFCFLALLFSRPAGAEHEVYFRYVVLGYVKDAKQAPLQSVAVTLIRDKTGFSYFGETDNKGFFIIVARLGDESVGEHLTVKTGRLTATVVARFDPKNHTADRGTRVDFIGTKPVERPTWFASTLKRFLAQ